MELIFIMKNPSLRTWVFLLIFYNILINISDIISNWLSRRRTMIGKLGSDNANLGYRLMQADRKQENGAKTEKKTVNASKLNLQQDMVLSKQIKAQKKALKNILDAFGAEQGISDSMNEHLKKAEELTEEANMNLSKVKGLEGLKSELKKTYDIDDDSMEQKDLELLQKQERIERRVTKEVLSPEEQKRLSEMEPLTEYQTTALEYEKAIIEFSTRAKDAINNVSYQNRIAAALKIEQGKLHTQVDAQKTADDIMKQATKEIAGMLLDEGKDLVDDKIEENKEKAEKRAEKEAELEKLKEKNDLAKNEAIIGQTSTQLGNIADADSAKNKFQAEIRIMIAKQKMLEEDIKGLEVDQQI